MIMIRLARIAARGWTLYRDLGIMTVLRKLMGRVQKAFGVGSQAAWLHNKNAIDESFDDAFATNTGGVRHAHSMTVVGTNIAHGTPHIAADPRDFTTVMDGLAIDLAEYAFVDLGSGMGRGLILANRYNFRSIIGVEFAKELHLTAQANMAAIGAVQSDSRPITLIHGDAADFAFPAGPILLFLYHPFGSTVMRQVVENATTSWRNDPRPFVVVYMNPVHKDDWLAAGWILTQSDRQHARLTPPQAAAALVA